MTPAPSADADSTRPTASDIYRVAVEEYRFQVTFNWSRTQYSLALNAAILAAAVAVASRGELGVLVFALGAVASFLSAWAVRTQHSYYRAARDRMRAIEVHFSVPADQRVTSTATLGGRAKPAVTVTQVVYLLFTAIFAADAIGGVSVLLR